MAVKIGSARIDENGKAHGGAAGDQTGKEVSTQNWYLSSKGWRVFRAKSVTAALKIAEAMERACANSKIGYDQYQRNTLYTQAEKVGFDPGAVTVKCETDCSALVRVCCAYAGIMGLPSDFRTGNMPTNLLKTGAFVELKGGEYTKKSDRLGRGDILVTATSGHTVVVLSDGAKYASSDIPVYHLGDRLLKNGTDGDDVRELQAALIGLGYDCGAWGADGDFGDATERAVRSFQRIHGLTIDGQYGAKSHAALMTAISETEPDTGEIEIFGGDCYVRAEPDTSAPIMGVAKRGARFEYAGQTSETGWHQIVYGVADERGWVSGKYSRIVGVSEK